MWRVIVNFGISLPFRCGSGNTVSAFGIPDGIVSVVVTGFQWLQPEHPPHSHTCVRHHGWITLCPNVAEWPRQL